MSRIHQIQPNYRQKNSSKSQNEMSYASRQSFCGVKKLSSKQETLVSEVLVKKYLGLPGKILNKLSETAGEVQNLLFMGVGTAFVSPIFIAYNPLSKEDEDTKKYSALRQPLSAILTTAVGFGINQPIANLFDKLSSEGKLSKFDMSAKPSRDYIKARYKGIIKHFDKITKTGKVDERYKREKEYLNMLGDDNIKSAKDFKEKYPFQFFETTIQDKTAEKAAERLLDKNNPDGLYRKSFKNFLIEHFGFKKDKVDPKILNPDLTKSKLDKIKAVDFLRALGFNEDVATEKNLRTFLNNNLYEKRFSQASAGDEKLAKEMFEAFKKITESQEVFDKATVEKMFVKNLSKKGFSNLERKAITRFAEVVMSSYGDNEKSISLKTLLKAVDIGQKKSLEDAFNDNGKILNKTMKEVLLLLKEKLKIAEAIESTRSLKEDEIPKEFLNQSNTAFLKNCAKEIAKNGAEKAQTALKSYSKIQGIVLSLIVLPFSCGLLNWTYPRFMEKFFPELAASKAKKGGE